MAERTLRKSKENKLYCCTKLSVHICLVELSSKFDAYEINYVSGDVKRNNLGDKRDIKNLTL